MDKVAIAGAETDTSPIPLVDLVAQHLDVADEVAAGFDRVLSTGGFIGGREVESFERNFAEFCNVGHCVGAANGTDAIEMLLRGLGIGAGDEVILPANTFIATAEAVARAGAEVVLVDAVPDTLLIDVDQVESRVTAATRAVIGVDLFGQLAPFDLLGKVVDSGRVELVEDAAQSQGASRDGATVGTMVSGAATSFYPGKNLGAYGDGGAVVTNDPALAARVRAIGSHGSVERYRHDVMGFNSRLDAIQAVVLNAKLARLDSWNDRRRAAAQRYDELLADVEQITLPTTQDGNDHVWHLYAVRVPDRDRVLAGLQSRGIGAGVHYPVPVHLTGAFSFLGQGPGDHPVAEDAASTMLSLPIFPHITEAQQDRIASALLEELS